MKNFVLTFLFAILLFVGFNISDVKALESGTYKIVSALDESKVVTSSIDGNVQLNAYQGIDRQLWEVKVLNDGSYIITNRAFKNKNLSSDGGKSSNFTNVKLEDSNEEDAQKWNVLSSTGGYYNIASKLNGSSFLDVSEAKTKENTNIQLYQNNGNKAQKFKFVRLNIGEKTLDDGYYMITTKLNSTSVLQANSTTPKDGENVNINVANSQNNQIWKIKYLENGFYQISSYLNDNFLLDVSGAKASNGTNVQLWTKNGNKAQDWSIVDNKNGTYSIVSALNYNYYLDVSGAKTNNGTNVQIWSNNGNNAQKFIFSKIDLSKIEEGPYNIASMLDENMFVGFNSGVAGNNVNIALYSANNDNGLKWYFKNIKDNIYEVKNVANDKYNLDVSGASKANGGNVQLWQTNGNNAQRWRIIKFEDGTYRFTNVGSGKNLDISGASKKNGTNVQQWENNGNNAQKFKLIATEIASYEQILDAGKYMFESALNLKKTVRANSNVVLYDEQLSNEEFITTEYLGEGFYALKAGDKALTNNNGNVVTSNYTGSDNQQWFVMNAGEYYTFISKTDGKALDISEAKTVNNTNIQTWTSTGHNAQKFKLIKVDTSKIDKGPYNIASMLDENMFIGINNEVGANNINVSLYSSNNSNGLKWYFENIKDNIYEVKNVANDKYNLDVSGASKANGGNVQLWETNGNNAQRWRIVKFEDGTYRFTNVGSGKNLDISGASKVNGTNVQQWENNGNNAQKFKLIATEVAFYDQVLENDSYLFYSLLNSNKTVRANSNVVLYDVEGSGNEIIKTEYLGNGFYSLKAAGRALTNNNGNIVVTDYTGKDNQQWFVLKVGENYTFISKSDGKALDISEAKTVNNTNVQTWTSTGHNAQKFHLEAVKQNNLKTDNYIISFDNKALGISNEVPFNGSKILLQTKSDINQQKWYIKQINGNLYQIKSVLNPNKVFDVSGANTVNGTPVQTWSSLGTNAQKWYVIALKDGGYKFISALSHTPLTINNGSAQIFSNSFSENQTFTLSETDGEAFGHSVSEGYYSIASSMITTKVVDVSGATMLNGTNVQLWNNLSLPSQIWKFNYLGNEEYSIISAMNPKRALTNINNNIVISTYNGNDNQKWYIKMLEDNKVSIISSSNGLYLDVAGANKRDGANIQLYSNNGNAAQKFILNAYGGAKTYKGIDVSKYQGNINWNNLSKTNINFVIMRVGYGMFTDQKDERFEEYYTGATSYDIPVGVYTFSYAKSDYEALREAEVAIDWLNGRRLDLPVFYDLEHNSQTYLGKDNLTRMAQIFCDKVLSSGYQCGIYANKNWLTNYLNASVIAEKYPIWLANYTGPDDYDSILNNLGRYGTTYNLTPYKYWQFSSLGRLYGINDNVVDLDFGYDIFD